MPASEPETAADSQSSVMESGSRDQSRGSDRHHEPVKKQGSVTRGAYADPRRAFVTGATHATHRGSMPLRQIGGANDVSFYSPFVRNWRAFSVAMEG